MALVSIRNKVEKISKNSQILHWNFKFLVKIEIYVTGVGIVEYFSNKLNDVMNDFYEFS